MKKILGVLVVVVILGLVAYIGMKLWQDRYDYFFKGNLGTSQEDQDSQAGDQKRTDEEISDEEDLSDETPEDPDTPDNEFVQNDSRITKSDCDSECGAKKDDTKEYDYCREICGFKEAENGKASSDCDKLSGFDKDVCYKRKAVEQKNAQICENIQDKEIKKSCKNRVIEEVLDTENLKD